MAASMLVQPDASASVLSSASVRPHLVIRDSCQPPG
jgi:LacI family transcriptional regulator